MEILFLGTSAGMPTRRRNVTSVALLSPHGRRWFMIDCGEGTQHQLLRASLSLHHLHALLITHVHGDHCYGLPGLLSTASMQGRTAPLTIIAPEGIEAWILASLRHTALQLSFEIQFIATEMLTDYALGAFSVSAYPLLHRVPSFAYHFIETPPITPRLDIEKLDMAGLPRGERWGQLRLGQDVVYEGQTYLSATYLQAPPAPRRILIAGDNSTPECLAPACAAGVDVLIHESTYTYEAHQGREETGHSDAKSVARFANLAKIPHLILTHFSPRYQYPPTQYTSIDEIRREASAHYQGALFLANDFDRFSLNKDRTLERIVPA